MSTPDVKNQSLGKLSLNKLRGMLMGVFLGDAIGAPYEFKHNAGDLVTYNGLIHKKVRTFNRFAAADKHFATYALGSMTDDSEMTLALARGLITNNGYSRDTVIKQYMSWANSNQPMMGKNTRQLFKGIKTIKGFEDRLAKITVLEESKRSQSNGTLMRCAPLAILSTFDAVLTDCNLSNPNKVNRDANLIQVMTLWMLIRNIPVDEIWKIVKSKAQTPEVRELLTFVENNPLSCDSKGTSTKLEFPSLAAKGKKGWVLNGLYCSMLALRCSGSYQDIIDWVVKHPGSDTDTNGAIAGAVIGAKLGYDVLSNESRTAVNIKLVKQPVIEAGDVIRPDEYTLKDFDDLCERLYSVGSGVPQKPVEVKAVFQGIILNLLPSSTPSGILDINTLPKLLLTDNKHQNNNGVVVTSSLPSLVLSDNKQVAKTSITGARVVCLKRTGGEVVQDCDVYIGRRITQGGWNLSDTEC